MRNTTTRTFNHDIQISDEQINASGWGAIRSLLCNPVLLAAFKGPEAEAGRAKRWLRYTGTASVALLVTALVTSAYALLTQAVLPGLCLPPLPHWLALVLESGAVVGLLLAWLASKNGPIRRRWLISRFKTEVLRQLHFRQWLNAAEIGSSASAYETRRDAQTRHFIARLDQEGRNWMQRLIDFRDDPLPPIGRPTLPPVAGAAGGTPEQAAEVRRQLLDAYETLRLQHQLNFMVDKLSDDDVTFCGLSLTFLVETTDFLAGFTLSLALACSVLALLTAPFHPPTWVGMGLAFGAITCTILGVAVRAWRDGLSLQHEREDYEDMRHRLQKIENRWQVTTDDERFALAAEVEVAATEELRDFLRSHRDAQFVL